MLGSIVATGGTFLIVFIEGIVSFFSPCVIPLIPLYMGYLAGSADVTGHDGQIVFQRKKVFLHTVFFVIGISFAFFILGMSFTALGTFFQSKQYLFTRIAGIIIILLGLFQLGIFESKLLNSERKIQLNLAQRKVNPFVAFIMGFTFSFAWTPCVGPALSSVLLLASTAKSAALGNLLVLVYAIGFIIPFLLLGLFTTQVLNFLRKQQKLLKYTVKVGGVILILIGIITFTGWLNPISGYLNSLGSASDSGVSEQQLPSNNDPQQPADEQTPGAGNTDEQDSIHVFPAIDFTLTDQYGNEHTLSDYKGKVVFLNFWATWCPPCRKEMPDIETIYQEYGQNQGDVIILGVANPRSATNTNTREQDKDGVIAFLDENKYTFPVVFDETGEVISSYFISAWPTTFLINKDGNIQGYVPGMMTKEMMKSVIEETMSATE